MVIARIQYQSSTIQLRTWRLLENANPPDVLHHPGCHKETSGTIHARPTTRFLSKESGKKLTKSRKPRSKERRKHEAWGKIASFSFPTRLTSFNHRIRFLSLSLRPSFSCESQQPPVRTEHGAVVLLEP